VDRLTKTVVEGAALPERKAGEDDAAYAKRWTWLGDGEVPGFGVKVYGGTKKRPGGRKVYALRYRTTGGRQRMTTLGDHGVLTVKQARDRARAEKVRVLDGEDPQAERERVREATGFATVRKLVTAWLDEYAVVHRRRWKEDKYRLDRHVLKASLGRMHLADVDVARLSRWHRSLGSDSPVEANRALETLRAAWRWAEDEGRLPAGAPDARIFKGGRKAKIRRFPERSRTRWLREAELRRLMEAVRAEDDPQVRAVVPLLVLTGLRKRELLHARWEHVDLDAAEIRLPTTKSNEEQVRALPPAAVAILRELPRFEEIPYVFPSPGRPSKPRDDIKKPWLRIREAAKLPDVTLHDLRRTAGSLMAQRGVPIEHIGEVLGHSRNASVTRIYARLSNDNRRDALGTLSDALSDVLGLDKGDRGGGETQGLPEQLLALVDATRDDPEALAAGLRALGLDNVVEA
jgi:integrase